MITAQREFLSPILLHFVQIEKGKYSMYNYDENN